MLFLRHGLLTIIFGLTLQGCAMVGSLSTVLNEAQSPARIQASPEQVRMDSDPELDGLKIFDISEEDGNIYLNI